MDRSGMSTDQTQKTRRQRSHYRSRRGVESRGGGEKTKDEVEGGREGEKNWVVELSCAVLYAPRGRVRSLSRD